MKILFVGCGSIGRRHIRNLKKYKGIEILAYRTRGTDKEFEKKYRIIVFRSMERALKERPDAVFVTNPTSLHMKVALKAAKAGANLFIEKPISHNLNGVKELELIARKKKLKVFIGYNMRFLGGLKKVKELISGGKIGRPFYLRIFAGHYLPAWRPSQDYTKSYSAKKSLGGGVILDLSHEIDYARWFLGEVTAVSAFADKISSLKIETEDIAEIMLNFKKGAVGSIHLDYLQRKPKRYCEVIGTKGKVIWDIKLPYIKVFNNKTKKWTISKAGTSSDMVQTYIDEMDHFIKVLKGKEKPLITLEDGKKALEIAIAAKESAKKARIIKLE